MRYDESVGFFLCRFQNWIIIIWLVWMCACVCPLRYTQRTNAPPFSYSVHECIVANIGLPHRSTTTRAQIHRQAGKQKSVALTHSIVHMSFVRFVLCFPSGFAACRCVFVWCCFLSLFRCTFLVDLARVPCVCVCVCCGCCRFQHFRFHKKSAHTYYRIRLCVSSTQITNIRWAQPKRTSLIQNIARVGLNHTKVTNCASTTFSLSTEFIFFCWLFLLQNSVHFLWQKIGELLFEKWKIWCFNTNWVILGKCQKKFLSFCHDFFVFFFWMAANWIEEEEQSRIIRIKKRRKSKKKNWASIIRI